MLGNEPLRKVVYAAAVMAGIALPFRLLLVAIDERFNQMLSLMLIPLVAAAVGGAIAVKRLGVQWPLPLFAAEIFALVNFLPFVVQQVANRGHLRDLQTPALISMLFAAAGTFLLPLLNDGVRRHGAAPTRWKVILVAVLIILASGGVELVLQERGRLGWPGHPMLGFMTLSAGVIGALVLLGVGLVLTAAGAGRAGAWTAALGLTLGCGAIVFWILTGGRWPP